ncbi:MAG TPA: serine hydrolase domain-containing protein [Methylomirabilota bacterium]|nr:serine hydrolase domain-containing protein [Methylomirabilota bacterium]
MSARLQTLLDEGVASGIFPGAAALVLRGGECLFEGAAGDATARTLFDLASLTKVMCTTAAFLSLWGEGKLEPDTPVARYGPDSAAGRAGVTFGDLLYHRAGLPAFRPFFAPVMREEPRLFARDCDPARRAAARRAVVDQALATPPAEPPRARAVYSDVGFLVLGELLSVAAGVPLDALFAERVAAPLGLAARFRRLSAPPAGPEPATIASTGATRPREAAPGQEGLWAPIGPYPSAPGEVDDDNAWAMDGVAGHAGLFGTVGDVAAFGRAVLDELAGAGRVAPGGLWERALRRDGETPGSSRALGFDTRLPGDAPAGSSAGRLLGARPPGAVGHLGFTGTSVWIDRARGLVVALCTNRTARGRAETRIRAFRPRFHDAVVEGLGHGA